MNAKVSYAVAAILGSLPYAASYSAPAPDNAAAPSSTGAAPDGGPDGGPSAASQSSPNANAQPAASADTEGLVEVTVTAQRRSENMQNVPISMQAFTSQTLEQLNISTFDDYVKFLPNVTAADNGPGQNEVFMRGLSAGSQASQGSGSTGLWPNVAIYLDNQSGQLPNRNLDIYTADLNRIEVLEGPQGTLFGAGAQAGVIRYITNAPNLDQTSATATAGYGVTAHGDPNDNVTAVLNVPLVANTFAVRAVIYDDHRGGYIDNVPATFARNNTDIGIHYADYPAVNGRCPDGLPNNGYCVPPGSPTINNGSFVGTNINPVTYEGIRVEALYQINDAWSVLITQTYQDMDAQGVFYQQPNSSDGTPLGPLEVTLFNNAYDRDKFENTAWTVNGKFGALNAVYTGGYLVRNVDQVGDYTNYARGVFADYYQCYGPASAVNPLPPTCFSPSATWRSVERNEHLQNELRLSTPDDWRLRGIVGAFYEDNKLYDQTDWMYKTIPPCTSNGAPGTAGNTGCLTDIGTFPDATVQNPGVQSDNSSFYQDTMRETKQTAFFTSIDFDLLPRTLTLTLGTRWFRFDNSSVGSVTSSFGCFEGGAPATGCLSAFSYDLNDEHLSGSESGFKSRGNLTWHITPDAMVYYTFSQGFRPGGFNQNGGSMYAPGPDGVPQYVLPKSYQSDKLTNNELGWKTEFFDHRLQWNGALYRENWDNVQIEFFDPGVTGNIFYDTNGQNFLIKGLETSLIGRVTSGLTLQGSASWNQSRQTNSPALIDTNPASVNYGKAITEICSSSGTDCAPITNPFGPVGAPSADAPPMQFNVRARYEWHLGGYSPFVQIGATHNDHSFTQAGSNPTIGTGAISNSRSRFELPAYSTYEASLGVAKDAWYVNIYGENLSDSNAATFISTDQFIVEETPLRPRVIGVVFGYNF